MNERDDLRDAVEEALSLSHEILPQTIDDVIAVVREHDAMSKCTDPRHVRVPDGLDLDRAAGALWRIACAPLQWVTGPYPEDWPMEGKSLVDEADPSQVPATEKCSSCGHECGYHFAPGGHVIPCDADTGSDPVRDCGCEQYTHESREVQALRDFQRDSGITVDGILGPQSWVLLRDRNESHAYD